MNKQKYISGFVFSFMFLAFCIEGVFAAGISSPYWNGENEKPLYATPGISKEVVLNLQNVIGEEEIIFKAVVAQGGDIAKITDESNVYVVPAGTKDTEVHLRVELPANTPLGTRIPLGIEFTSAAQEGSGSLAFGTSVGTYFDVVAGEQFALKNVETTEKSSSVKIGFVLGGLILLVAVLLAVRARIKKRDYE